MAIKVIGKIILYEPLTQAKIDDILASADTVILEIERRYAISDTPEIIGAVLPTQFDDVAVDYIESFKNVVDISSFIHEENVLMYKVNYDSTTKTFDLTDSYIRNEKNSTEAMGVISDGQMLNAVFVTPGLNGPVYTTIELPYNQSIPDADVTKLEDLGLTLAVGHDGALFSFSVQKVPYKVSFYRPEDVVLQKYNIEFNYENLTIEL